MPKKNAAPSRKATANPVANGAVTQPAPNGSASTPPIGATPQTVDGTPSSDFDYLGWFTVDGDGCTVQFGIEQQRYVLAATSANYNAMFSMLLACWLDRHKVNLTYASPLLTPHTAESDPPLRILSLVTI
jgi:hypothetical protein